MQTNASHLRCVTWENIALPGEMLARLLILTFDASSFKMAETLIW